MSRHRLFGLLFAPYLMGCNWLGNPIPEPDPVQLAQLAPLETTSIGSPSDDVDSVSARGSFQPIETFNEWDLETAAADALGRIGAPAVPRLMDALRDPNPEVRLRAIRVLTRIGQDGHAAVPALIESLNDVHPLVRKHAARALGQIGPDAADAVPALMQLLNDSSSPNPPTPSFYQRAPGSSE